MPESTPANKQDQKSGTRLIYKLFRIITVVKPGELPKTLLLSLNIFLIFVAYYILKILRDTIVLDDYGAFTKNMMSGIMVILLIFAIKAYSKIASKVSREKLITWVTLFFIINIGVIFFLFTTGILGRSMSLIYFIWVGIFNLMIVAQFWGFANDLFTEEEGKRLFPIIMFGANLGGFIGAMFLSILLDPKTTPPIVMYLMLLVSAVILGFCILLTNIIHKRELKNKIAKAVQEEIPQTSEEKEEEKPLGKDGGFKLVFKSRYLLYIAFFVLLLNVINTTGEYIRDAVFGLATDAAVESGEIAARGSLIMLGKLVSNFYLYVNIFTLFVQLFVVSRLFKYFGVRSAVFVLPFIALGGNIAMSLGASLIVVVIAKVFENGTDYSLTNTTRQALFLITSREEKYKAKVTIDAFFQRAGDLGSSILVIIGTQVLFMSIEGMARVSVVIAIVWIFLCVLIAKEYKKKQKSRASQS
ncbi:NTP/NDP exchange transporter [Acidobacteriota bacterium]